MSTELTKLQPINHILHSVPIKLELNNSQYNTWSELFKVNCKAHDVLAHLTSETIPASSSKAVEIMQDVWERHNAIVLQWIYATISKELLRTIMEPDLTSKKAWDRLKKLKNLADQLADVDSKISPENLVLQMVAGLNKNYSTVATNINQMEKLPSYYDARSKLILKETMNNRQAVINHSNPNSALIATDEPKDNTNPNPSQRDINNYPRQSNSRGRGRNSNRGRSNG
ncbi:uncharacterized protein [Rutidosis leptorrhynchoides]|uniref:uncharacterized protein n=1 Tax=Rutidosis leptorrhynchoides TaxID=125765 RepID=UPI003A9943D3